MSDLQYLCNQLIALRVELDGLGRSFSIAGKQERDIPILELQHERCVIQVVAISYTNKTSKVSEPTLILSPVAASW